MKKHKIGLTGRVFIGFALGIILGIIFREKITAISFIGTIFLNLVKMNVVPLIFFSIVSGVASMSDITRLKKIGIKTVIYYIVTTILAACIGLFIANTVHPGNGLDMSALVSSDTYEATEMPSITETITEMFPSNIVTSMAEGSLMQIIIFSVFLGVALVMLGEKAEKAKHAFSVASDVMCKITDIVMQFSPIGVCALMACVTGQYGTDIFGPLAKFILCVFGAQVLVLVVLYSIMLKFIAKVPLKEFYKKMIPVWLMTLSTTSSSATLPLSTKTTTKDFGVSDQLAGFTLPLGATINMNGAVCFYAIATMFVAQIYGVDFGIVKQISLILLTTCISVGSPGIPGGAIVMTTMLLSNMGLPLDAVGVLAGINRLIDMGDTSLNVTGDIVSTLCIARTENMYEESEVSVEEEISTNGIPTPNVNAQAIHS